MPTKNPSWERDELILALDLYFRLKNNQNINRIKEVQQLSDILNILSERTNKVDALKFRNANSISMKLSNFLQYDLSYSGKGLTKGGKLDKEIWDEYSNETNLLRKIAQNIIDGIELNEIKYLIDDEETEFPEGKVLFRQHKSHERNKKLINKVKKEAINHNNLVCTVCNFDFKEVYGDLGAGFIECHHTFPVSEYGENKTTKIDDLALVCSNCHRMLHRKRPWLKINELKKLINFD